MYCKKNVSTILLERRIESYCVRFVDKIHEVHFFEWETSSRLFVVREATYGDPKQLPKLIICGDWHVKSSQEQGEARMDYGEAKLDNAQKLRGIYVVDLEDGEYKKTIQNAR